MNNRIVLLAVDDEQIIIDSIKKLLNKEDNFELHFAYSVNEALKIIETADIDIILTDLMMPEKDGLEFLKILKVMQQLIRHFKLWRWVLLIIWRNPLHVKKLSE